MSFQWLRLPFQSGKADSGAIVRAIREQGATLRNSSLPVLREQGDQLRLRMQEGAAADSPEMLIAAGGLIFSAIHHCLGFELYDVQLLAGVEMARGRIAEMATGEGKTLTAALPTAVWGLTGRGVHMATVNQYLAQRDCEQLKPIYSLLGLSVELLPERAAPPLKKKAYAADITYGAGYEFGFDYLRDQSELWRQHEPPLGRRTLAALRGLEPPGYSPLQRSRAMCVIDEIDGVLIDEARTPLVLSQGGDLAPEGTDEMFAEARRTALRLQRDVDYTFEPRSGIPKLTERGRTEIEGHGLTMPLQRPWAVYVQQALHAEHALKRDIHYVVNDDGVQLVDEFTGRIFADRKLRSGLHQAVESKEGLAVSPENPSLAKICRQRFYLLYDRMCGMTGTATGNEGEFSRLFKLKVAPIPLARPSRRVVFSARYFASEATKFAAIIDDVVQRQSLGQPVLIGSRTIRNSEALAELLHARGFKVNLLNGKQDLEEAEAVAQAGQRGSVTVATNMAGRGTDIRLGPGVAELGGLHVIGVERHESRRIDRQLVGRCARQGDPGSCQFFVSADDELLHVHGRRLAAWMKRRGSATGEIFRNLTPALDRLQSKVEVRHYRERLQMIREDERLTELLAKATGKVST